MRRLALVLLAACATDVSTPALHDSGTRADVERIEEPGAIYPLPIDHEEKTWKPRCDAKRNDHGAYDQICWAGAPPPKPRLETDLP